MPRQTPLTGQDVLKFFLNENPGSPLVVKQKFLVVFRDHSYITSALVGGEEGSENANFCLFLVLKTC